MVDQTSLNQAWGALRVVLREAFSFYEIKDLAGLAGIDVTRLARLEQKAGGGASKRQLMTALDREIAQLGHADKARVLNHFAEEVVRQPHYESERLDDYLERLGWQFADGKLVPINVFDVAELANLPDVSKTDLLKAATRLRDGDLSGALGAACAAVDSATNAVYADHRLGPEPAIERQLPDALHEGAQRQENHFTIARRADRHGVERSRRQDALGQSARRPEPGRLSPALGFCWTLD